MATKPPFKTRAECLERAKECERMAAASRSDTVRETMLYLASRWRMLADDDLQKPPLHRRTGDALDSGE